jgi:hypothetical protein
LAAPSHPVGDQGAFVLGHRPPDLEQELIVRILTHGSVQELNRTAALGEFLDEEYLMHIVASQAIRSRHQDQLKGGQGGAIPQPIQAGTIEPGPTIAVIAVDVFLGQVPLRLGYHEDWKSYEGWGQLTKQPDEEGSRRSLILSLRLDHCLLCHPYQQARLEHKLPAGTVGSLPARVRVDSFLAFIRELRLADSPHEQLNRLTQALEEVLPRAPSKKHMNTRDLGRLEATPTLQYRAEVAYASL